MRLRQKGQGGQFHHSSFSVRVKKICNINSWQASLSFVFRWEACLCALSQSIFSLVRLRWDQRGSTFLVPTDRQKQYFLDKGRSGAVCSADWKKKIRKQLVFSTYNVTISDENVSKSSRFFLQVKDKKNRIFPTCRYERVVTTTGVTVSGAHCFR